MTSQPQPQAGRPDLQADYGVPDSLQGTLPWAWVEERLTSARNYWVVTVGADGAPQSSPVWAIWHEDAMYFSCGSRSRKAWNLAHEPRVDVHLESGDEVVILKGLAERVPSGPIHAELIAFFRTKYGHDVMPDSVEEISSEFYVVKPLSALAWSNFPGDVTK